MALFAYAVGRVRALEARLIGAERFRQLEESAGWEGLLPELAGLGYPVPASDRNLSEWLRELRAGLWKLSDHLLEGTDYPYFYRLPIDFNNLVLLARSRAGLMDSGFEAEPGGSLETKSLESVWSGQGWFRLPAELAAGLKEGQRRLENDGPDGFEYELAGAVTRLMLRASGSSELLARLAVFFIDGWNLRSYAAGGTLRLPGGRIAPDRFGADRRELLNAFSGCYPAFAAFGRDREWPDGAELEAVLDRTAAGLLEASRFVTLGPEPVLAYHYQKCSEITRLHRLLLLKSKGF
ncbi:MAG TPA: hypothetical protein PKM61_00960 [bacterium]|nr:hypothetical protein [bacterium]